MKKEEGLRDLMFLAGMLLMAVGLAIWSAPLMFTIMGGILMVLALAGAWRSGR